MKKIVILLGLILLLSVGLLWSKTERIACSSSLVTLKFNNVKLKKIEFVDDVTISYKVNSDSAKVEVTVKDGNIIFSSPDKEKKTKISLYLPKSKTYQTYIENTQLCKFDHKSIIADIGDGQKIIIKDGTVKVLDENNNQVVSIGGKGIYVNDENELVKIDGNGIFIKSSDEEIKNYNGFWAKLLGKTITGFTGLVMDLSLKNIGKNVVKIINEQNLRIVSEKMQNININMNISKYQEQLNKNIVIKKNINLFIDNYNGDILIKNSNSDTLKINAVKYSNKEKALKKIKIDITKEKSKITIHTYKTDELINGSIKLSVYCPKKVAIEDILTSNGDIVIKNVKGNLNAITSNGDITISKFSGDVKALTSNGKIFAEKINGDANLVTSNGPIDAKKITGLVTAKTTNGKINLQKISLLSDVSSSNSEIFISTRKFLNHTEIKSSNGRITIAVPQSINMNLTAITFNGKVSTIDLPFKILSNEERKFRGKLGNGTVNVTIKTSNSDIIIKKYR